MPHAKLSRALVAGILIAGAADHGIAQTTAGMQKLTFTGMSAN